MKRAQISVELIVIIILFAVVFSMLFLFAFNRTIVQQTAREEVIGQQLAESVAQRINEVLLLGPGANSTFYIPATIQRKNYSILLNNDSNLVSVIIDGKVFQSPVAGSAFPSTELSTARYRVSNSDGFVSLDVIASDIRLFSVKNASSEVLYISPEGELILNKTLVQNSAYVATGSELLTVRYSGENIILVAENGTTYIDGVVQENQNLLISSPTEEDIRFRDGFGNLVAYFDTSGNIYLQGNLLESELG